MKTRAAKFMAAVIVSILSSANAFAAPDDAAPESAEQRADTCLTSPRDYTPPGTRWRYRLERGTGRHCWYLKDDAERTAGKAAEQSSAAAEEPAPAPQRRKPAPPRSVSDARAEFSQPPVQQDTRPGQTAPSQAERSANMLAPAAAARWPDPISTVNSTGNPPAAAAAPADQGAEVRPAPATTPAQKPPVMPRAVPPMPASEKPMSLPMLITIVAGGFSVFAVLVSLFFAWLAPRRARLTPSAPMPPLESPDQPRRPGDLYRMRKRMRAQSGGRHAA
ncbi:hypothetical protein [Bradyrhizobium sp.]|uniref:hypothetical protein n=1 Tax=Bradyrhizobium sp. TaxID=376 RepID=UPI001D47550F|nr:hypothetical protein [Bradyrhizobium sp.]MBI5319230.1 hypothetical protein [Bradyrhizobium sp.]